MICFSQWGENKHVKLCHSIVYTSLFIEDDDMYKLYNVQNQGGFGAALSQSFVDMFMIPVIG